MILESARDLLHDTDYRSITVEAIAEAAEVSPMTVFNYFGSKGGLLLSLVTQSDKLLVEKIRSHISRDTSNLLDAITGFSYIIIDHASSYLDRKTWGHVLSTSILEGDSTFGKGFYELEMELVRLMSVLLRNLESKNLVRMRDDPMDIAYIIYNVHNTRFIQFSSNLDISVSEIKRLIENDLRCLCSMMIGE